MNKDSTVISLVAVALAAITMMVAITNKEKNKETTRIIWQNNKDLNSQLIELRTDVDILKGQMEIYENLPIDMRARIEILENRYENLIFFQREIDMKKKLKSPKNAGVVK